MTSWLEKGRPALFKALEEVCQGIDTDLANELQDRDQQQHAFLTKEVERLRPKAESVKRLEQENQTLRDELDALRKQVGSVTTEPEDPLRTGNPQDTAAHDVQASTRQPLGIISASTLNVKAGQTVDNAASEKAPTEFANLRKKYTHLQARYGALKQAYEKINEQAHKTKSNRDSWIDYSKKLEAKVQRLESRLGRGCTSKAASTVSPQPSPGLRPQGVEKSKDTAAWVEDETHLTVRPPFNSSLPAQVGVSRSFSGVEDAPRNDHQHRASSSPPEAHAFKTTEQTAENIGGDDEDTDASNDLPPLPRSSGVVPPAHAVTLKPETPSDGLQVLYERPVAKRKRDHGDVGVADTPTIRRIKTETLSSDPIVAGETHHFSPQESIDLDTEEQSMRTPRRHRVGLLQQGNLGSTDGRQGGNDTRHIDEQDELRPDFTSMSAGNRRHMDEQDELAPVFALGSANNRRPSPGLPQAATPSASSHFRLDPKTSEAADTPRPNDFRLERAVASLAEDRPVAGDRAHPGTPTGAAPTTASRAGRLEQLLNGAAATTQAEPVLLRPIRQTREAPPSPWLTEIPRRILPFSRGDGPDRPLTPAAKLGDREIPSVKSTPGSRLRQVARPSSAGKAAGSSVKPQAREPSLRDQPLAKLRMDDFKINPKFNNGDDFAYSEVVRGRAERAEIPGCTDPNCCGPHFRGMAQAERQSAGPSLIYRSADIKLLEEYLGDQAYRLGSMSRQEKEELWLEAKTLELANKHGKHRHRFARQKTPPGFWNTDFPTTQEVQEDRVEADKRERRFVEERWKDAMRGGGKWLFRDE